MDLSYNSLDKKACEELGKAIHDNHTLWGLHLLGNECILDSMGFIRPGRKTLKQTRDILHSPIQNGNNLLTVISKSSRAKVMSYQKCWICEGWTEIQF